MTTTTFDFSFSHHRATATEQRKTVRYWTSIASAATQYLSAEVFSPKNISHGTTTADVISGVFLSSNTESAKIISDEVELVNSISRRSEKLLLERKIVSFLSLEDLDDDSAESLAKAVPEALVFINELSEESTDIPLPSASIDLDGIITLEWKDESRKAAAMFEGGDDYGYAYYKSGKYVAGAQKASAGSGIPGDLTSYLTA